MRVGLVANPSSGRGRAPRFVGALRRLAAPGLGAPPREIALGSLDAAALEGLDAVVLVGGDGTLHHALGPLLAARVPTLLAPLGTENVVAGELGLGTSARSAVEALRALGSQPAGRVLASDVGMAGGTPFALMLTVGFDAAIVEAVARRRSGPISRIDYVVPTLGEALRPTTPRLRVLADGREVVGDRRGWLVVAVGPRYPLGLNPARGAVRDDGRLDVVFVPARTTVGLLAWLAACRLGLHATLPGCVRTRAAEVDVRVLEGPAPVQIDGEAERPAFDSAGGMRVRCLPGALPLVLPAPRGLPAADHARPAVAG